MCGRSLRYGNDAVDHHDNLTMAELLPALREITEHFGPRYNIAPTQVEPVVLRRGGAIVVEPMAWDWPSASHEAFGPLG